MTVSEPSQEERDFLLNLERRHMSSWSAEELEKYNRLTGQHEDRCFACGGEKDFPIAIPITFDGQQGWERCASSFHARAEPSRGAPPHLVHEAYAGLLRRAAEYDEKDWETASKFERHAINAALDLKKLRAGHVVLLEALRSTMQSLDDWLCDDTISDETQSEMLTLEDELSKLLRKFEAEAAIQQAERT